MTLFLCRFLPTGYLYQTISGSLQVGISTFSTLIPHVVTAIWDCLVDELMAMPGVED